VLEFNCRLGDPETQAILMRANFDFAEACAAAARGNLKGTVASWSPEASVCVVMASKGYPGKPEVGQEIRGLYRAARNESAVIFHAGTRRDNSIYYTNGGRVLGVAAAGKSLDACRSTVYDMCSAVDFSGRQFRRDIAVASPAKARGSAGVSHA